MVTSAGELTQVQRQPFNTADFETAYGTTPDGSFTNKYALVGGDSGGGDFIYDAASGTYAITGLPEPSSFGLLALGLLPLLKMITPKPPSP